MIQTKYWNYSC